MGRLAPVLPVSFGDTSSLGRLIQPSPRHSLRLRLRKGWRVRRGLLMRSRTDEIKSRQSVKSNNKMDVPPPYDSDRCCDLGEIDANPDLIEKYRLHSLGQSWSHYKCCGVIQQRLLRDSAHGCHPCRLHVRSTSGAADKFCW